MENRDRQDAAEREEQMDPVRGALCVPEKPEGWSWRKNFPEKPQAQREVLAIAGKETAHEPLQLVNRRILLKGQLQIDARVECIHCTVEIFCESAVEIGEEGALWLKHCEVRSGEADGRWQAGALSAGRTETPAQAAKPSAPQTSGLLDKVFALVQDTVTPDRRRKKPSADGGERIAALVTVDGALHLYDTLVHDLAIAPRAQDGREAWAVLNRGALRMADVCLCRCEGNWINDADEQPEKRWFDDSLYARRVCTQQFAGRFLAGCPEAEKLRATLEDCTFRFSPCTDGTALWEKPFVELDRARLYRCAFQMETGEALQAPDAKGAAKERCIALTGCLADGCSFARCTRMDLSASELRSCRFDACAQIYASTGDGPCAFKACAFTDCGAASGSLIDAANKPAGEEEPGFAAEARIERCRFTNCAAPECLVKIEADPHDLPPEDGPAILLRGNRFVNCRAGGAAVYIGNGDEPMEKQPAIRLEDNVFEGCVCAGNVSGLAKL